MRLNYRLYLKVALTGCFLIPAGLYAGNGAANKEAVERGSTIYNSNCVFCHQADAIGKTGLAPSLTNKELLATASDKFFMSTIRDGRVGTSMIPYAHLGRESTKDVVAYLRSFEQLPNRSKSIDRQPKANGNRANGEELFRLICSTCHGPNGDGYLAGGSGSAIGKAGFLSKATDGFIRETIKYGRSNTRMLPFQGPEGLANLNDQEIDDIIVYLRSL